MRSAALSILIFLFSTFAFSNANAQSCDCNRAFSFVRAKVEENFAGFQDKVRGANAETYQAHTSHYDRLTTQTEDIFYCVKLIRDWVRFFNEGHVQLVYNRPDFSSYADQEIRNHFANTRSFDKWTEKKALQYLKKNELDPIEGIWENASGTYRTFIRRGENKSQDNYFMGTILKADSIYWMPGQVKVDIYKTTEGYVADYYYRDHHPERVAVNLAFQSGMIEFVGLTQWKKKVPSIDSNQGVVMDPEYFSKHNQAPKPEFSTLDDETNLLILPSFGGEYAFQIDSLIRTNMSSLTSKPNLIIDLRGNEGGTDFCYAPIIPILYTHPIFTKGVSIYASEDNIRSWEILLEDPNFSPSIKARIQELVEKMKANRNGFIEIAGETTNSDTVFQYPSKVGIIIDNRCASSAEQFLLAAKQSKKVTLFGQSTAGVVDYSNMRSVPVPCFPYTLEYATSRSNRLPYEPIDNQGIMPDVMLSHEHNWVAYVKHYLKKEDN